LFPVADFDGDGTRDVVYKSLVDGSKILALSSCPANPMAIDDTGEWMTWNRLAIWSQSLGATDMDHDGRADILVINPLTGYMAIDSVKADCSGLQSNATDLWLPSNTAYLTALDYDGDGIPDVIYTDTDGLSYAILHHSRDPFSGWPSTSAALQAARIQLAVADDNNVLRNLLQDFNGDGTIDASFDDWRTIGDVSGGTPGSAGDASARIYATDASGATTWINTSTLDISGDMFNVHSSTNNIVKWMDVNGDGLPDLYTANYVYINRGGALRNGNPQYPEYHLGTPIFQRFPITNPTVFPRIRQLQAVVADIDSDGRDELLVPYARASWGQGGQFCRTKPAQGESPSTLCGADFDSDPQYWASDRSVFQWAAYRLAENGDGTYTLAEFNPGLIAPINTALTFEDLDGNGMKDIVYTLTGTAVPNGLNEYYDGAPDILGLHVGISRSSGQDLLIAAAQKNQAGVTNQAGEIVDPTAVTASWSHVPLSQSGAVAGCAHGPGSQSLPFYTAHLDDESMRDRSAGYAYFSSSMYAVATFGVSNGLGQNQNYTCYRYEDAMLNEEGRGFQGFKVIHAEEQLPVAQGEVSDGSTLLCDAHDQNHTQVPCSPNNLATTTKFFQEFPLTSRVQEVIVQSQEGATLSDTKSWWYVTDSVNGSMAVEGVATQRTKYESTAASVTGSQLSQTTSISRVDVVSGDPEETCTLSSGTAPGAQDTVRDESRSASNLTSEWWLGRLDARTVVSDFYNPASVSLSSMQLSGAHLPSWATGGSLPVCPTFSWSTGAKTQSTTYGWNDVRELDRETVLLGGVVQRQSVYEYDGYGNQTSSTITGFDLNDDVVYPPQTPAPSYVTTRTFPGEGYFVATEINPVGHLATLGFDPATGQVTTSQPVQSGPVTARNYDSLGRLLTTHTSTSAGVTPAMDTPPIETRLLACTANANCVIERQTWQNGTPAKVEYLDRLGRPIAVGAQGFDGKEVISQIDYNARGAKVTEYAPASTAADPGHWNGTALTSFVTQYSKVDLLGRPGTKTVVRDSSSTLFAAGQGSANLITNYGYSVDQQGETTSISVYTPTMPSGEIDMSRMYDARGKLVQTTQRIAAHDISTGYAWDPMGNLVDISQTANGVTNHLTAQYDDLGRKTQVTDPDRGIWSYSWDGLGRVRTQTDARGVVLAYSYDPLGRIHGRFMKPMGGTRFFPEARWSYDLNGALGALGEMVGVENTASQLDGSGNTFTGSLDDGSDYFQRRYVYDNFLRPTQVSTHIPGGAGWQAHDFSSEVAYDANYGRPKATLYPGGEMVEMNYNAYGYASSEAPLDGLGVAGTPYRTVSAMSVRGQITGQVYGNSVAETAQYDASTGMPLILSASGLQETPPVQCAGHVAPMVRTLSYRYDQFLNLASQTKLLYQRDQSGLIEFDSGCQPITETVSESYVYDELQRLKSATRGWSAGITVNAATSPADAYSYDDLGNIVTKSDNPGTYLYTNGRPHAVSDVGTTHFDYDANGNMTGGDGRTVVFDNFDRPIEVKMGETTTVEFRYAPDGSRYVQSSSDGTNEYYVDKMYEQIESAGSVEGRTHISDAVEIVQTSTRKVRYRHFDRLGSLEAATTDTGGEDTAYDHGYDAFGDPRSRDWQSSGDQMNQTDERGFTGHEHLDNLRLIHMNGRVYDYKLGRFLSVDPIISNPANSQSVNPYSYIGNNPLSGVDPTGYEAVVGSHIDHKSYDEIRRLVEKGKSDGVISNSTPLADGLQKVGVSTSEYNAAIGKLGINVANGDGNGAQTQQQSSSQPKGGSVDTTGAPAQVAAAPKYPDGHGIPNDTFDVPPAPTRTTEGRFDGRKLEPLGADTQAAFERWIKTLFNLSIDDFNVRALTIYDRVTNMDPHFGGGTVVGNPLVMAFRESIADDSGKNIITGETPLLYHELFHSYVFQVMYQKDVEQYWNGYWFWQSMYPGSTRGSPWESTPYKLQKAVVNSCKDEGCTQ
jgi:RHS repeat-associated protein